MIGSDSIDLGLENIWRSWFLFRKGKKRSNEITRFEYRLEENLFRLHGDLIRGIYQPGPYRSFEVTDTKRRTIAVTQIRDRVVHRLLYEHLVTIFDRRFVYDAWSCRKGKGVTGAIARAQSFLRNHPDWFVWRADITKFFDHIERVILLNCLRRRISDTKALELFSRIIAHAPDPKPHARERERESKEPRGIPIGNLTSQIFANIYLHELDWHIKQHIRAKYYVRYGDDFIILAPTFEEITRLRAHVCTFLLSALRLEINNRHDRIVPARQGIHFLGVYIYPYRRQLNRRNWRRAQRLVSLRNYSSYRGIVQSHERRGRRRRYAWHTHILSRDQRKGHAWAVINRW
ncbi:group II intron reverse transcriptase domain-containing protein [Candidatus Uhrbacteria bacterium]|nr:group II intron reverse transcriptase domain-containing protein [Candidatus Uhrbacteria bacterium]